MLGREVVRILEQAEECKKSGQLIEAVNFYRSALQQDPDNVDALYGWACVAHERGNVNNSLNLLNTALQKSGENARVHSKLGSIYFEHQHLDVAKEHFIKAIECDPSYLAAYANLAVVCIFSDDPWEAEKICRKGMAADKNYGPFYTLMGKALHNQGRAQEAEANYKEALKLSPEEAENNLCSLSMLYADISEKEKAEEYALKALETNPESARAYYLLSNVHKYKNVDDPHIQDMKALLGKLTAEQRQEKEDMYFALARVYDQIGAYDEAFPYFAQGNFLVRSTFEYSTGRTEADFLNIKRYFKNNLDKKVVEHSDKPKITPIFIVGMPRSGSTLIEQILASHSEIEAGGEAPYLSQLHKKYSLNIFGLLETDAVSDKKTLAKVRGEYLENLKRHAPNAKFITDKMPGNFRFIGLIKALFPEAKIIHSRRDPMDTCVSIYKRKFASIVPYAYDLQELGAYYKNYEDLMAFWHKSLSGFVHDVQYENLISKQEKVSKELIEFCGLKWEPTCLDFYKKKNIVMTASALQVKKPLYRSSIGSWKNYAKHLALLEKSFSPDTV